MKWRYRHCSRSSLEARLRGRVVQIGSDGDVQQVRFADAGRKWVSVAADAAQSAEGIEEHRRGEAGSGPPARLGRRLAGAPVVDPPCAGVGADEVVLQAGQEVLALAHHSQGELEDDESGLTADGPLDGPDEAQGASPKGTDP